MEGMMALSADLGRRAASSGRGKKMHPLPSFLDFLLTPKNRYAIQLFSSR
jgi:hypothetical protein